MAQVGNIAADQLRSIVERIERLEEEKANIASDVRDVYAEAKANGYDVKGIRQIVRLRKLDTHERDEQEYTLDLYKRALGLAPDLDEDVQPDLLSVDDYKQKVRDLARKHGISEKIADEVADNALLDSYTGANGEELYQRAVEVVKQEGTASTSYLQRRIQISYSRAATFMDRMEKEGIVSPPNHVGKREVLQREAAPAEA